MQTRVVLGGQGPERQQEQHGLPGQARAQVGEPARRRRVGPLHVVDGQQQRALQREVRGQPVQAVQHLGGVALGEDRIGAQVAEDRLGRGGRASEQARALLGARADERGLEQLAYDGEGEVTLELAGVGDERGHPERRGDPPGLVEQRRLPHPGRSFDEHDPAFARTGGAHARRHALQLGCSLQQHQSERKSTDPAWHQPAWPGQREDMRATPDRRDDSDTFPAAQQAGRGGDP